MSKTEEKTTQLWRDYENGRAYQSAIKLQSRLSENVNFFEGRQWALPTENTKNLPRPIYNIVKQICRNKVSNILSTPVRLVYKSYKNEAAAEKFTRFADYISKEMRLEELDADAIRDGVIKGSYFFHFYWDAEAKGLAGRKEGGVRCELVDPTNVIVANPREVDIQKQKWVMVISREEVDAVKEKADEGVDLDLITGDDTDSQYDNKEEQEGTKLCTVLTRYARKKGEVYFEKAVKGVTVNAARPLTPDLKAARSQIEDEANTTLPESDHKATEAAADKQAENKASVFPIVGGVYEKRENCIYGLSEVEGLIQNQKSINFSLAMKLLNEQELAWGKLFVKEGALRDQDINNDPAQVITDYSQGAGQGFYRLQEPVLSNAQLQLIDTIISTTRNLSGATEVMSGEMLGANMSGAAIAQLQSQAQLPIEELRDRFWRVKERQGKVLEQFFKLFYEDAEFVYTKRAKDENGQEKEKTEGDVFNGKDYIDTDFSVNVEAVGGTRASMAGDINALDNLFAKGAISAGTYIRNYPDDALGNKTQLITALEGETADKVAELTQVLQQREAQLQQSAEIIQRQNDTVSKVVSLIQESRRKDAMLAELQAEYTGKITQANEAIREAGAKYAETFADASTMAQQIVNNRRNSV